MKLTYKGYILNAYEQIHMAPFKPFVCLARKENNGKIKGFNVEGINLEEAIQKAKDRIDEFYS